MYTVDFHRTEQCCQGLKILNPRSSHLIKPLWAYVICLCMCTCVYVRGKNRISDTQLLKGYPTHIFFRKEIT